MPNEDSKCKECRFLFGDYCLILHETMDDTEDPRFCPSYDTNEGLTDKENEDLL